MTVPGRSEQSGPSVFQETIFVPDRREKSVKATDPRGVLSCRIKPESSLRISCAEGDAGGGRDDGQVRFLKRIFIFNEILWKNVQREMQQISVFLLIALLLFFTFFFPTSLFVDC